MNRLYRSNAERIREVVLYDYVRDDFRSNDVTESDEDYVEARESTLRAQKMLSRTIVIAATKWTLLTTVFITKASRYGVE
jgi:hypothetical protein